MGLSNDDFRKMMTPRVGDGSKTLASRVSSMPSLAAKPKKKQPSSQGRKPQKKKKSNPEYEAMKKREKELAEKYRDRAAERRQGIDDKDYVGAEELKKLVEANTDTAPIFSGEGTEEASAEQREKEIEQSKYLGGDISRTHLVKGLDFALLEKTQRENIVRGEKELQTSPSSGSILRKTPQQKEESKTPEFHSRLGRSIFETLFPPPQTQSVKEMFAPGRMVYEFTTDQTDRVATMNAPPRVIIRSQADAQAHALLLAKKNKETANDVVINKLIEILSDLRAGKRKNIKKKQSVKIASVVSEPPPPPNDDEKDAADVDIFADLDDYEARVDKDDGLDRKTKIRFADEDTYATTTSATSALTVTKIPSRARKGSPLPPGFGKRALNDDDEDDEDDEGGSFGGVNDLLEGKKVSSEVLRMEMIEETDDVTEVRPFSESIEDPLHKRKQKTGSFMDAVDGGVDAYDEYFPGDQGSFYSGVLGVDSDDEGDDDEEKQKAKLSNRKIKQLDNKKLNKDMKELDKFLKKRGSSGLYEDEYSPKKAKTGGDDSDDDSD